MNPAKKMIYFASTMSYNCFICVFFLKNISDSRIRSIIFKGPKYRDRSLIDFKKDVKKLLVPFKNFVIDNASKSMLNLMLKIGN